MHVVKLNVLPRGHVADCVGILFGQVGEEVHLVGIQTAKRDLDPLHARRIPQRVGPFGDPLGRELERLNPRAVVPLAVVVPLSIYSAAQARLGEHLVVELALALQRGLAFKGIDFARQVSRQPVGQLFLPRQHHHTSPCPYTSGSRRARG